MGNETPEREVTLNYSMTLNSVRLFFARPASVSFVAMGIVSP
jgi:hypothetical protein